MNVLNLKILFPRWYKIININILKNLKKYKSINITRPDKGNGVVIFNKKYYIDNTESILSQKVIYLNTLFH